MSGKQGIILYLKQWVAQHGTISSQCYQIAHTGGLTPKEIREAIRRPRTPRRTHASLPWAASSVTTNDRMSE